MLVFLDGPPQLATETEKGKTDFAHVAASQFPLYWLVTQSEMHQFIACRLNGHYQRIQQIAALLPDKDYVPTAFVLVE